MTTSDILGFIGVSIILIAFLMNITNFISTKNPSYILMNFVGAGLACYASILLKYIPFIILEGTWTLFSLGAFINLYRIKRH